MGRVVLSPFVTSVAEDCLKPGVSFAELDAQARAVSDLQAARALNAERARLFQTIASGWPDVA